MALPIAGGRLVIPRFGDASPHVRKHFHADLGIKAIAAEPRSLALRSIESRAAHLAVRITPTAS
jgi:hypothetical protein